MTRTARGSYRHTELEVIMALKKLKHATAIQVAKELDVCARWITVKFKVLKNAGRIYISDWAKLSRRGDYTRVMSLRTDKEVDQPKPTPKTPSERSRVYAIKRRMQGMYDIRH